MKALILAAAVALALPALAAEDDATSSAAKAAPQEAAQPTTPAAQTAPSEQVASEGISKDVTLQAAPSAQDQEKQTLRFEDWARQAEDEPFETDAQWNAHNK
jgi:hypothetical protein